VPVTVLFDQTNDLFDPVIFDCVNKYSVTITETKTVFDGTNNLFDPVIFDTAIGGIIAITDTIGRLLASQRPLPTEIETISDGVARKQNSFRTIAESAVTIGAGVVGRLLATFRELLEDIDVSDSVAKVRPTSNRYLYDLGALFDPYYFDSVVFDTGVKSYSITDSVDRKMETFRALADTTLISEAIARMFAAARELTQTVIITEGIGRVLATFRSLPTETETISDGIARKFEAIRSLADTTVISEAIGRAFGAIRGLPTETIIISDLVGRAMAASRSISEIATTISDSIGRQLEAIRALSESVTITEVISRVMAASRSLPGETTTISDGIARVLATFRSLPTETRVLATFRSLPTETIIISDAVDRIRSVPRTITEAAITITGSVTGIAHIPAMVIYNVVQILRTSRITTYIGRIIRNTVYG